MISRFDGLFLFLSNFYPVDIVHEGIKYPSVEHYYVAMKTTDVELRKRIAKIPTPNAVKKFGRQDIERAGLLRPDWNDVKLEVMEWGLRQKFKDPYLKNLLISTENEELIEGNWWHDNFFGSCTCKECGNMGKNHLGRLLMIVRNDIK